MPLQELTSQYEQLRQELPPESAQMARECQAFQRARVIKSADEGDLALNAGDYPGAFRWYSKAFKKLVE